MGQATSLVSGLPRRYTIPDRCNHMGSYACQCKDVVLRDEGRYLALALDIGEHQPSLRGHEPWTGSSYIVSTNWMYTIT